jgi:hypothetical protein
VTGLKVSSVDAGRTCPYCRFPLKAGSVAERCDVCATVHHEECWHDGGGCSRFGCTNQGSVVIAPAPPPVDRTVVTEPPVPSSGSSVPVRWIVAGLIAALLLAGGVAAAIVAVSSGSKSTVVTVHTTERQVVTEEGSVSTVATTPLTSSTVVVPPTAPRSDFGAHNDVVAFSGGEGVRYRNSPYLSDLVPGNGPFEGDTVTIYCYTTGEEVKGNSYWAKVAVSPDKFVPATFLLHGHDGPPPGVTSC